jgi:hypothetical protein
VEVPLQEEDDPWVDGLEDDYHNEHEQDTEVGRRMRRMTLDPHRRAVFKAAQAYLERPIKLKNVAHSIQPIRIEGQDQNSSSTPKLEVNMIVCPHKEDTAPEDTESSAATMRLVRMVNQVPLLDGAEASACGLVQGMSKKAVWGSFGLHVAKLNEPDGDFWTPRFDICDSDQVAPFFQSQTHKVWEARQKNSDEDLVEDDPGKKRKRHVVTRSSLLPAKVRLGQLIVVVQIRAAPSSLPLPTLSKVRRMCLLSLFRSLALTIPSSPPKGRLPLNHGPIDNALQIGIRECLRSLQTTSPGLLLTPAQLHTAEREVRYMPATAVAVSRVLANMSDLSLQEKLFKTISRWQKVDDTRVGAFSAPQQVPVDEVSIAALIEERLRQSVLSKQQALLKLKSKTRTKQKAQNEENEYSDMDGSHNNNVEDEQSAESSASCSKPKIVSVERQSVKSWNESSDETPHGSDSEGIPKKYPPSHIAVSVEVCKEQHGEDDFDDEWW